MYSLPLAHTVAQMVETELELVIDKTLDLFRFLKDKDIFERYYKQHLAKRLILNKTSSDETELSVISKLKVSCKSSTGCPNCRRLSVDTASHRSWKACSRTFGQAETL